MVVFSVFRLGKFWQPFGVGEVSAPQGKEDLCRKRREEERVKMSSKMPIWGLL